MRTILLGAASVASLVALASAPLARSNSRKLDSDLKVTFAGCPMLHPIEGGCLTVTSKGETYLLNAANPRPNPALGRGIIGSGILHPGTMSVCMMGKPLRSIQWQYSRMKCPIGGEKKR
jgi:hypothetical protein